MSTDDTYTLVTPAPDGQIFVCAACGKVSTTRSGFLADWKTRATTQGWDESCMLHAVLCHAGGPPWTAVEEAPAT